MNRTTRRLALLCALLVASLVSLACDPVGPIAGGRLSGEVETQIPSDWSFTDAHDTVQLETGGDDPYSVNIWATALGGELYAASGSSAESRWAANIEADPNVRLRIDGTIYELRAERIELTPEFQTNFRAAIEAKYDYEIDEDDAAEAWVYRLQPR